MTASPVIYGGDLARDLGFPGMVPEFWRWCRERDLTSLPGRPYGFDPDDVRAALSRTPASRREAPRPQRG